MKTGNVEKDTCMNFSNQLVELIPTGHAEWRMAQRNVSWSDIEFVLDHGSKLYRNGVIFYYLRRCDIPNCVWQKYGRLEGTTVVFSAQSYEVVTVYRGHRRRGLRRVKRKPIRSRTSQMKYH
jgi:hypothetical protein